MSSKILLLLKSSEIYIRLASAVKEIYKMGCASLGRPLFVYGSILPQSVKKSRKSAFCYLCNTRNAMSKCQKDPCNY